MLDASVHKNSRLPNQPGVGYKPQHFNELVNAPAPVTWLEGHAENYMGDGGRPLAQLRRRSTDSADVMATGTTFCAA